MTEPRASNRRLYDRGRRCAGHIARHAANGETDNAVLRRFADARGRDFAEMKSDHKFFVAVELIAQNVGPEARETLLDSRRHLPAKTVMQVSRTHPERQRYAMQQVAEGRSPWAKPPAGVAPPYDTLGYYEIVSRLARSTGLLVRVANGLRGMPDDQWPAAEELLAIRHHLAAVRTSCTAMARALRATSIGIARVKNRDGRTKTGLPEQQPRSQKPFHAKQARGNVASARGLVEKNARDLPRLMLESPPPESEVVTLLARLRREDEAAKALSAVIGAGRRTKVPETGLGRSDKATVVSSHAALAAR